MGESGINGQVLLKYLPAAYQEDEASRAFLEKLLGVFASELDVSERLIDDIPNYFDPFAVDRIEPPDGILSHEDATKISWLSLWLSLDLYELLGDTKSREYLLRATEFYKKKGTARGLEDLARFLTGRRCDVKEYINNVFRSYGMEHCDERDNDQDCSKVKRKWSRTVHTNNADDPNLLADMGTPNDRVHYTWDSSKEGMYSPYSIGLFITVPKSESLEIDEKYQEQLKKIIESFLPALVNVKIRVLTQQDEPYPLGGIDSYTDLVQITDYVGAVPPKGSYSDEIPEVEIIRTYPYACKPGEWYRTNDTNYWTYMLLGGGI